MVPALGSGCCLLLCLEQLGEESAGGEIECCVHLLFRPREISVLKREFCWGDGGWKSLGVSAVGYSRWALGGGAASLCIWRSLTGLVRFPSVVP